MLTTIVKNKAPDSDEIVVDIRGSDIKDRVWVTISRDEGDEIYVVVEQKDKHPKSMILGRED